VAANGRYYGGGYKVSPGSLPDDGLMEVYLVDSMPKIRMAGVILSMKHAGHLKNPAVHMIRTKELQIISDRPINASIDGEAMQSDHFDLKLIPKGIALEFNSEFIDQFQHVSET
jgi:diacylglycerol kinase family enzyme